jgi:hypothetical protein
VGSLAPPPPPGSPPSPPGAGTGRVHEAVSTGGPSRHRSPRSSRRRWRKLRPPLTRKWMSLRSCSPSLRKKKARRLSQGSRGGSTAVRSRENLRGCSRAAAHAESVVRLRCGHKGGAPAPPPRPRRQRRQRNRASSRGCSRARCARRRNRS